MHPRVMKTYVHTSTLLTFPFFGGGVATSRNLWDFSSPDQGSNPGPRQWELRVLTTHKYLVLRYSEKRSLFTIAKWWKQPKSSSTDEWMNKLEYIYTMKYLLFSHIRNEVSTHTTTRMDLENIMLRERSQMQKTTCYFIPVIGSPG